MKKGSQGSGGKLNLSNSSSGKKFSGSKKIESYTSLNEEDEEPIKSFRATKWRWVVLIIGWVLLIGSYFCYDMPNSLSDLIEKYITHETDSEVKYNQLYSIYSYPNIILPLFGGMLIDKIGIRFSLIFFTWFLVVGQGVFMFSGYMESTDMSDNTPYYIALAGRIIFGMGAETLGVVQNTLIAKWFMGKELSLALGIDISIGRFGNVMNNYITPPVGAATSLGFALMIGFVLCILSLIWALITIWFEGHAAKIDKLIQREENSEDEEEFHWSDLKQLGWTFWWIAFFWWFIYVGLFCFNNISNEFFMSRYGFSQTNAARITGNVFLISVFLAPLFGYLSDRIGHKVTFTILSGLSLTLWHALYVIIPSSTPQNISYLGIIPICLMGFTYTISITHIY